MPELLTKHPKIVIDLLLQTGKIKLTKKKQILKSCPDTQFLQVFDKDNQFIGELCVYDLSDIDNLTQFSCDDIITNSKKCSLCQAAGHNKANKKFHPK